MNKKIISTLVIGISIFAFTDIFAKRGYRANYHHRYYNTKSMVTISGKIENLKVHKMGGLHFRLINSKNIIDIHLGPKNFINKKINLKNGDIVTIIGSQVTIESQKVILAKSLTKGTKNIVLRNNDGSPVWSNTRRGERYLNQRIFDR